MSRAWMNHVNVALIALTSAACNLSDQLPTRQPGDPCATDGARAEQFVCRGGVWTPTQIADMAPADTGRDMMTPAPDMPADMDCVGESDVEICTMLGRCALEMSVVDRCDNVRNVICPDSCAQGICIPATGLCEGDCIPTACPTDIMCGRVSNGCGAMQLCDACAPGTVCDPDSLECVCDEPDPADVCQGQECGLVEVENACGEQVSVSCGTCEVGYCNASSFCQDIQELDDLLPDGKQPGGRFGHSLDLDGDLLMVGAPDETHAEGVGNAYIFQKTNGAWSLAHDAREKSATTDRYLGFAMGWSVAISQSDGLAIIGKTNIDAPRPYDGRVDMLYLVGSTWMSGLTLASEGSTAGRVVAMAPERAAIGSSSRNGGEGIVNAFTFIENDPTQPFSNAYNGNDNDRLGFDLDLTSTQLVFGAPGTTDNVGACMVALHEGDNWGQARAIDPVQPQSNARFCSHVTLRDNVFAATYYNRIVNGEEVDAVQLFSSLDGGRTWEFRQEILDPEGTSNRGFGAAMSFTSDGKLLIGNPLSNSPVGDEAGTVYVYHNLDPDQGYALFTQIKSPNPASTGHFGHALATSGNLIVIGAPGETVGGVAETGRVYTLTLDGSSP